MSKRKASDETHEPNKSAKSEDTKHRQMPTETIATTVSKSREYQNKINYDIEFELNTLGVNPESNLYDYFLDRRSARVKVREREALEEETVKRRSEFKDTLDESPRGILFIGGKVYSVPLSTLTKGARDALFGCANVTEEDRAHLEVFKFGWFEIPRTKSMPLIAEHFRELIIV
ncbi:MAG: hypothetical protein KGL39_10935 [Patescibacteria group bacterium]|nr:hypothetical protein [Patescibacteria group bacterium]